MGKIYSQAAEVVVWFGKEESWTSWLTFKYPMIEDPEALRSCFDAEACCPMEEVDVRNIRMAILVKLIEHEYWSRLWTVQEFLLPRKLQLRFGELQLSGTCFTDGIRQDFWTHEQSMSAVAVLSMQKWTSSTEIEDWKDARCWQFVAERTKRESRSATGKLADAQIMPLYRALNSFSEQQCFEYRNKVFGLLGLCQSQILVDHEMPTSLLYLQALMICLQEMLASTEIDIMMNPLPLSNLIIALSASLRLSLGNRRLLMLALLAMDVLGLDRASGITVIALTARVRHPRLDKMLLQHSRTVELLVADVELKQLSREIERLRETSSVFMLPDGETMTIEKCEAYLMDMRGKHHATLPST